MKSYGKVTPDDQASGSMLPAILGISDYSTPNDSLQTCIRAIDGLEREDITNESMTWGNDLEGRILVRAAERLGLDNLELDHQEPYHHKLLKLACSLDGTADGRGLVVETNPDLGIYVMGQPSIKLDGVGIMEAKLTAADVEDAPPLYRGPVQLQAQMDCFGASWGAVCTLYKGTKMRIFLFARHEPTLAMISRAVIEFEGKLQKYRETKVIDWYPPKDSADANRMFPVGNEEDEVVYLGEEEDYWAHSILEAKKIAALAEVHYAQIAPHLYCGPIVAAANIQLAACIPNFLILESIQQFGGFHAELLKKPLQWEGGYVIPSKEPGLGVELNEAVALAHPYDSRRLHLDMAQHPLGYF